MLGDELHHCVKYLHLHRVLYIRLVCNIYCALIMFTSHSIAHVRYNIRRLWRLIDSSMERSHCDACRYISWISLSWISLYWQYIWWWWWWWRWWTLVATSLTAWAGLTAPQEIEEGGHGLPVVILSVLPFRFLSLSSIAHWGDGFTDNMMWSNSPPFLVVLVAQHVSIF